MGEVQHGSVVKETPDMARELRFTRNKHTTPAYTWAHMSWVRASSSSEHETVVVRHARTAVEESSNKSDSVDNWADIKRLAGKAAADKIARCYANTVDTSQLTF